MSPYRKKADMREFETEEQKAHRERERLRMRHMRWIAVCCALPVGGVLTIGAKWGEMTTAMGACSIVALVVASIGMIATGATACQK